MMTVLPNDHLPSSASLRDPASEGTIHLSPVAVSFSAIVLLVNGIISLRFKLGLHTQLVVASVRMVVQLSLLGYVLVPIFTYDKWWLVLMYSMFMLLIASFEAVQRPSYTFKGVLLNTVLAMAASSGLMLSYMVLVVLGLRPVWEAQYVIPLLGMLLGNATSAASVGLSSVLEDLAANRALIEHLLALGANRFEATEDIVRRALKVSMTPLLNQMNVMGIVSIPGMMTGQILAGGDPTQAARYQMVIMFIVTAATSMASVSCIYLAVLHVVDSTHTFREDRLLKNQRQSGFGAGEKWARWTLMGRRKGAALGRFLATACCCCLYPAAAPRRRLTHGGTEDTAATPLLPTDIDRASIASTISAAASAAAAAVSSLFLAASRHSLPWQPSAALAWMRVGTRSAVVDVGQGNLIISDESAESSNWSGLEAVPGEGLTANDDGRGVGVTSSVPKSSSAAPRISFEKRSSFEHEADGGGRRGSSVVNDTEENSGGSRPGLGDEISESERQALLGTGLATAAEAEATTAGASLVTRGSSILGNSVASVVAVGGWLGSQASSGWGIAWSTVGRWRSPAGTTAALEAGAGRQQSDDSKLP